MPVFISCCFHIPKVWKEAILKVRKSSLQFTVLPELKCCVGYNGKERLAMQIYTIVHVHTDTLMEGKILNRWLRGKQLYSLYLSFPLPLLPQDQTDRGDHRGQTPPTVSEGWGVELLWKAFPDSCFCHYHATWQELDIKFMVKASLMCQGSFNYHTSISDQFDPSVNSVD